MIPILERQSDSPKLPHAAFVTVQLLLVLKEDNFGSRGHSIYSEDTKAVSGNLHSCSMALLSALCFGLVPEWGRPVPHALHLCTYNKKT